MPRVLVTGGAGFIGSHLCDELVARGYEVRVLDNLDLQVHGPSQDPPDYLNPKVQFLKGDITETVVEHLLPVDYVVHLAAKVGVGQSAYQPSDYTWHNTYGTSMLLECLQRHPAPKRLIVASSMSVYGEGPTMRLWESHHGWRKVVSEHGPTATSEDHPLNLSSIYALTKYDQERLCLLWGQAYSVPTIALRFFNVYGTRQSLSNPYTGVMAIFASRLLNGKPPIIFEDGQQSRDFVHVSDIVQGIVLALESDVGNEVINIGSGEQTTILEVADMLAFFLGKAEIGPELTGKRRVGDIRHCFADISKAQRLLGYQPQVNLVNGVDEYVKWLKTQVAVDRLDDHVNELVEKGLLK